MTTIPTNCLSVEAAADYLGVVPLTIRRLIARKKLKALRVGRRVIITPSALAKFLDENPAVRS
jgi:excisionase family DNA binding protein